MKLAIAVILGTPIVLLGASACTVPAEPTAVQPADSSGVGKDGKGKDGKGKDGKKKFPIKLKASRTKYKPEMFAPDGDFTCVKVTVTNQSKRNIAVNPLYFSLTGADNFKHEIDMMAGGDDIIDTTTLAPGEKAKGTVCSKGSFKAVEITMTNELLSEAARARVSK